MKVLAALLGGRVLLVDLLAGLFGMGAWLSVNAMYTQLPILIASAPESWNLASYIVVLIQAANIGGILYALLGRRYPGEALERGAIYFLEAVGIAALALMAFFYQEVTVVGGQPHSVALLALVFLSALLACTSSVLFVPYMNRFAPTYLVSYMIGEGLSSLLPSVVSLVQGVSGDPVCVVGDDGTRQSYTPPPVFSTRTYLVATALVQAVSLAAFALLDRLPACREARVVVAPKQAEQTKDGEARQQQDAAAPEDAAVKPAASLSSGVFVGLLATEAVLMAFSNGLFPSIQSYSCQPYGTDAYHLAINLGAMANPLACYLLFFVVPTAMRTFGALTSATLAVAVYILVGSLMSPTPPLLGIASVLRERHPRGLFWWGAVTQVGSLTGAVLAFVLLNYTTVFQSYFPPSPCDA
ncbi:hypothetical protein FOCC_FOCC005085 [Frankliniella occidentalis]|nr:hypothetical protein FOCC_FOCC005085 [Frankliniella occidentalis]